MITKTEFGIPLLVADVKKLNRLRSREIRINLAAIIIDLNKRVKGHINELELTEILRKLVDEPRGSQKSITTQYGLSITTALATRLPESVFLTLTKISRNNVSEDSDNIPLLLLINNFRT